MRAKIAMGVAAFAVAFAVEAASQDTPSWHSAVLPLFAEPLAPEALTERTVAPDEPFMVRKLWALKSATLQSAISTPNRQGDAHLPAGGQVLIATDHKGREFWCGSYAPDGLLGLPGMAYNIQWICLEDADRDNAFEASYQVPPNAGAFLPSFGEIFGPFALATPVPYTIDADADRPYYEAAVRWQKTFNIYNAVFFWAKVRRGGDDEWSDLTSSTRGVLGGYEAVRGKPPKTVSVGGATFTMTARGPGTVTVKPESSQSGVMVSWVGPAALSPRGR